jgi:hypothetical protein
MVNKVSLKGLMLIVAIIAFLAAVLRNAVSTEALLRVTSSFLLTGAIAVALMAILYLVMLPVALLGKYVEADEQEQGVSPFAQDRLPTQNVIPVDRPQNQ